MKTRWAILLCTLVSVPSVLGQVKPANIASSPASSTPAAFFVENFPKVGCPNVAIVTDESKADYVLEAHEGDFEGPNGSEGSHPPRAPQPRHGTHSRRVGKLFFGTTPIKEKSAVKDVCKYLQTGSK